jgi:CHAT domain-containing protein/tetratricopeptide (TPR) repeat protein
VTRELPHASRPGGCPDPALIAAHADRRLTGAEAARMDEHVAGCPDCYDVFASTVQFGLAESEAEIEGVKSAETRFGRAGAGLRSSRFARPLSLAAAAALVVALGLWAYRTRLPRSSAPLVAELADAMGARRLIEPRLTGGFRYGRLVTLRSGETPQGLDAQPATVLAAVARIRERAENDPSPEALGALGVTYLVSGDGAAAVKALESGSAQKPDDARLLSDLSAAYLVRAKQADEPADIPKALEAAERAVALPEPPVEAYFNRALALEGLHLVDAARKAWQDYLDRDPSSPWADEARQHLEALANVRRSSIEEEKARVRAAIEAGPAAIDRLAEDSPSVLRAYFEDELLPAWADAHLIGNPEANLHRERAHFVSEALSRSTGDDLPQDAVRALSPPRLGAVSPDPLGAQALGYQALREGKRLYDRQQPPCSSFRTALAALGDGGSPYLLTARLQLVSACLYPSAMKSAIAELASIEAAAAGHRYFHLLGRVHWMQGLIRASGGELTESLTRYRSALECFRQTRDTENEAVILGMISENFRLLGDTKAAWRDRQRELALLGEVSSPRRIHALLTDASRSCQSEGMPRTALHFATAVVDSATQWSRPAAISEALIQRMAILHSLDSDARAIADLIEARRWIAKIGDRTMVERRNAEADAAEADMIGLEDPAKAARLLEGSIAFFQTAAPVRAPAIHLRLARAYIAQGLDGAGEQELLSGIQATERQRALVHDPSLQVSFFDEAGRLFDEMVRVQVLRRHDPKRALGFVERGHGRQVLERLVRTDELAFDPDELQRALPDRLTLVYYLPLDDRLFAWTLSRTTSHFMERPLPEAELSRLVAAHLAAVVGRAPEEDTRRSGARLYDELVRPFISFFASDRALVFIPTGALQSVPFASLWNAKTGRYLVEDYVLGTAPSGGVFLAASRATTSTGGTISSAVVVGNPKIDGRLWSGLPNLSGAEAEAEEIAGFYSQSHLLTGSAATKEAFLDGARRSQVVHYAGHAISSEQAPSVARLMLAPDARTGDSGALYLAELGARAFPQTRVIVLAACRTAGGSISRGEGALSLGRPLLAAGVPDVISSLWDIDDAASRHFFILFHRALVAQGDPLLALRTAQVALLRGHEASLAHPASWAAFIGMGGLDPHSLSKGDES